MDVRKIEFAQNENFRFKSGVEAALRMSATQRDLELTFSFGSLNLKDVVATSPVESSPNVWTILGENASQCIFLGGRNVYRVSDSGKILWIFDSECPEFDPLPICANQIYSGHDYAVFVSDADVLLFDPSLTLMRSEKKGAEEIFLSFDEKRGELCFESQADFKIRRFSVDYPRTKLP